MKFDDAHFLLYTRIQIIFTDKHFWLHKKKKVKYTNLMTREKHCLE